jgi:threonine dehydrogenase-like Zn-dependent dehydrogenase
MRWGLLRWVAIVLALAASGTAHAQCSGYFESTYNASGYYATGYLDDGSCAIVPNVIGEASSAAADTILEAAGLDLGTVTVHCSSATLNQVIDQTPPAGTIVTLGALIAVSTSNNTPCEGRPPLWLQADKPWSPL